MPILLTMHFLILIVYRALEKVDKEQLNWKRFENYHTISCFGAFLLTLSLNNIAKLASKSIKLNTLFQIIFESICVKFLSTLLKNIYTSPSSPSLTYFWVQLFPVPYVRLLLRWVKVWIHKRGFQKVLVLIMY